jgi:hypothetical protein
MQNKTQKTASAQGAQPVEFPFSYIGSVNSSAKIAKGEKYGIDTFIIYLAPWKQSGFNVCAGASPECIDACLDESGQYILTPEHIRKARIAKTQAFYNSREQFCRQLFKEIARAHKSAIKKGHKFAVRINGTSDLSPELFKVDGVNILQAFPAVQFYDYTKIFNRSRLLDKYSNYQLTFSFNGHNWTECEERLNAGQNVSAVFNVKRGKELPKFWAGFPVVDGDITDYRPEDGAGVIVGLRFKRIKDSAKMERSLKSAFVLKVENLESVAK